MFQFTIYFFNKIYKHCPRLETQNKRKPSTNGFVFFSRRCSLCDYICPLLVFELCEFMTINLYIGKWCCALQLLQADWLAHILARTYIFYILISTQSRVKKRSSIKMYNSMCSRATIYGYSIYGLTQVAIVKRVNSSYVWLCKCMCADTVFWKTTHKNHIP